MFFPNPPQKPSPPDKTVEQDIVWRQREYTDFYNNPNPPNINKILQDLEVPLCKESFVTVEIAWSQPDFPMPACPRGILAIYRETEIAPNPFYDSEYKEYLEKQKEYHKKMLEYKELISSLVQEETLYCKNRVNEIVEKIEEINCEIAELEYTISINENI